MNRPSRLFLLLLCLVFLVSCTGAPAADPLTENGTPKGEGAAQSNSEPQDASQEENGASPTDPTDADQDPEPSEEHPESSPSDEKNETEKTEDEKEEEKEEEEEEEEENESDQRPDETSSPAASSDSSLTQTASPATHTCSFIKTSETKATCEKEGKTVYTCSCGATKTETKGALGHSFSDWKITKEPTATSTGTETRTCSRCGKTETKTIPKISVSSSAPSMACDVLRMINEERAKAGLPALTYYNEGQKAANIRAEECASFWSHTRPDGREWCTVWDDLALGDFLCAENLAYGQTSAAELMDAWMNSTGHRENILRDYPTAAILGQYTKGGISYYSLLFVYCY